jgi:cobalt transporter subunit CbtA
MPLFRNVVFMAAIAGVLAGIVLAALQGWFTVPLILEAELIEHAAGEHEHGGGWAPAEGFERFAFTTLASVVTGIGFGLILAAVSEMAGGIAGWRQGMVWGLAGFAVFTLAPGLGLPPELPGMPAAELAARQAWWIATVFATAGGLALIAFGRRPLLAAVGFAVILAPHLWGAPAPSSHASEIPESLHQRFVVATTLTGLGFWLVLGVVTAAVRRRLMTAPAERARADLA